MPRAGRRGRGATSGLGKAARSRVRALAHSGEPSDTRVRAQRRRRRGRGVEGHPSQTGKPRLHPGVRVVVAHHPLAGATRGLPGGEAGGHARRHPAHAQKQRHRTRELLAVAPPVLEEEALEGQEVRRRRLGVGEAVSEVELHPAHVVIRRPRPGGQAAGERVGTRVGGAQHRARAGGHAAQGVRRAAEVERLSRLPEGREPDLACTGSPRAAGSAREEAQNSVGRAPRRIDRARGGELRRSRTRRVDVDRVGVARAQLGVRAPRSRGRPRAEGMWGAAHPEGRARAEHLAGPQAAHDHRHALAPGARLAPRRAAGLLAARVGGDGHRSARPLQPVEGLEVLRLEVDGHLRAHAQHLPPVARPVDRTVGVLPVEALAARRAQRAGNPLGGNQGPARAERGRGERAAEGGEAEEGERPGSVGAAHALEPQDPGEERKEPEALPHAPAGTQDHRGHGGQSEQRQRRGGAPSERRGAGPEAEQAAGGEPEGAAEQDHAPHPGIHAVVGGGGFGQAPEALGHSPREAIPTFRGQQPPRNSGRARVEREQPQPEKDGRRRAHPARPSGPRAPRGAQAERREERGSEREQHRPGRCRSHQGPPALRAEQGERDEEKRPDRERASPAHARTPARRGRARVTRTPVQPATVKAARHPGASPGKTSVRSPRAPAASAAGHEESSRAAT